MSEPATFSGFGDRALPFLKALGFHQNREWFHENKKTYEKEVKIPLGDLVEAATVEFEKRGIPLRGTRKTSLYRVNRDIRFSKNKDPYNTHASALLTRSADKKEQGFAYVHVSNERSFVATGFYSLSGDELRAFRELMVRESDTMKKLVDGMAKHGFSLDMSEALKRMPRGFAETGNDALDSWLRLKHFTFIDEIDNSLVTTPKLMERMVALGELSMPFLNFGWRAIDPVRDQLSE